MNRIATFLFLAGGTIMCAACATAPLQVRVSEGWVIFDPTKDGHAYRYGPSIIINEDDSIDTWFASPGGPGEDGQHQWDWIRHKRSVDGGKTWSDETIVLKATVGSRDRQSVCDPGVIRFGGWYYLGVTAVEDPKGMDNEVFVARSKSPTGPFEKWNGTGWGGPPQPLIAFRDPPDVWGLGEPSFVKKGDTLFVYYTIISKEPDGTPLNRTLVATAPAGDPNWPARLTHRGIVCDRDESEDSADVKYIDAYKRFIMVSTASRMGPNSYINVRESKDGIAFSPPTRLTEGVQVRLHNMGISGTPEGHIDLNDANFIAYAYGDGTRPDPSWAFWHTFLNPITLSLE